MGLTLRQGLAALTQAIWSAERTFEPAAALMARTGDRPSPRPRPAPRSSPRRSDRAHHDDAEPGEVWNVVRRAQGGDPDAFAEIYDRYIDTVFRYVYFRVGARPLAEDLTSETFLRALRRIGSVTWQGRDLGAWLVTIARNLIADHYKSGRYRLELATADMLDVDQADRGPDSSPAAAVLERLTNATVLEAVKKLNPEQQECIVLRFLQGLSVTETAQAMGKNEGAIKALQYRAVRSLGRLLPAEFTP
jgi:RNA polymerase sigma-70 factor (ECF subfamily)